jgi:hypothetical protein
VFFSKTHRMLGGHLKISQGRQVCIVEVRNCQQCVGLTLLTLLKLHYTRWLKYDRDKLWLVYTQIVPVIFEPPCKFVTIFMKTATNASIWNAPLRVPRNTLFFCILSTHLKPIITGTSYTARFFNWSCSTVTFYATEAAARGTQQAREMLPTGSRDNTIHIIGGISDSGTLKYSDWIKCNAWLGNENVK